MSSRLHRLAFFWGGVVLLGLGLYLYVQSSRMLEAAVGATGEASRLLSELRLIEQERLRAVAQRDAVADSARAAAGGVQNLLQALPEALVPSGRKESRAALMPEWMQERVELQFADADLELLAPYLVSVEALPAPWRLLRLRVDASPGSKGRGNVKLVFARPAPAP